MKNKEQLFKAINSKLPFTKENKNIDILDLLFFLNENNHTYGQITSNQVLLIISEEEEIQVHIKPHTKTINELPLKTINEIYTILKSNIPQI